MNFSPRFGPLRVFILLAIAFTHGVALRGAAATVRVEGEAKQWHKVTLTLTGPAANETDRDPNPFTDYRFEVTFTHQSGAPRYTVPGYFAADGDAANTSANEGNIWRAHFAPDRTGTWSYRVVFRRGKNTAIDGGGARLAPFDGLQGEFNVTASDKTGRDFRGRGWLHYVGKHHLRFAGSGEYFLKAGPDSPETLLAYRDFDDTVSDKQNVRLKTWEPHIRDWREGDPTWAGGKGKGLIGAINYLAGKGMNTMSFLPYNAGGDGDNVWPFVSRQDKLHYDCSKLEQWAIVFDHAQANGVHLHFKLQENEMDDNRVGTSREVKEVPESLDNGALGPQRKLYLRELIARFGHLLGVTWNLGEENTQTSDEIRAMAQFIADTHYHPSNIVLHTFTNEQEFVYTPLLGAGSALTGLSLQNDWSETHEWTVKWVRDSAQSGRPWVVANDEQGHWAYGVPPDPGYEGFDGVARDPRRTYTLHEIRKLTLWGNLMGGGAGVEYYFGYRLPAHDINAEDFRSRDRSWDYARIAVEFFHEHKIPFWEMQPADELVGNSINAEPHYCLAKPGEIYLLYLAWGDVSAIDLRDTTGEFTVKWFNPRTGGELIDGPLTRVRGGQRVRLGLPPREVDEDWVAILRR
ncbi:MAG TPA: DUF5060 domain-containing protein [Opitutus sp.]|nr:DUF5060 domain-containing protein [Opitutus sp.]